MPVPRRRHCPARRDRGRTHKNLSAVVATATCPNPDCGAPRLSHQACPSCGEFQGRYYPIAKKAKPAAPASGPAES